MKRRKILVVIPALGLLLTGCSFQEGFATAKHWVGQNIYHPVKDWIDGLIGKKEEPTPEPEPGPVDPGVASPVEITEVRAPESIVKDATLDPASVPLSVKYSDGTTKTHAATDVKLDTSTVAQDVQGTAYYNDLLKTFTIDVVEAPVVDVFTPEEVIAKCDEAGSGVVVQPLLRVRGEVALGAKKGNNGWEGSFVTEGQKVLNFESVRSETEYESIEGKIVTIEGYAELYDGSYKIGYLPKTASPTGEKFNPTLVSVEDAPQKTVSAIVSVEGPSKVYVGDELSVDDFIVNVEYSDGTTGQVRPDAIVSGDASETGERTIVVNVGELEGSCKIVVEDKPTTGHAGTEEDPYTGADAVLVANALSADEATTDSFYIEGVVEKFSENFNAEYGNYSFEIDGGFVGWRLKKGPQLAKFSDGDLKVGDTVTIFCKIQNYKGTTPESKDGYIYKINGEKQGEDVQPIDPSVLTEKVTFELGENGDAAHADGTSTTTYTETVAGVTLQITDGEKMFQGARDAKGNGCLKFGTSSAGGSFKINVAAVSGLEKVVFNVANYKSRTDAKISIDGGEEIAISGKSDAGEYDVVEAVVTSGTVAVAFPARAMLNYIEFVPAEGPVVGVESVAIDQGNQTLHLGNNEPSQVQLSATVLPEDAKSKTVTWLSSEPGVAIISADGLVQAVAAGTTQITATAGGVTSEAITVTVIQHVESVTIPTSQGVVVGEEAVTLSKTIAPANVDYTSAVWSVEDVLPEGAIAIDATTGEISASQAGTANVYLTVDGVKSNACAVTATANVVHVESVSLDLEELNLEVGQNSSLVATVSPEGATYPEVSWKSSDEEIAKVDDNGVVTGIAVGEATITVTTTDGSFTDSCVVNVSKVVVEDVVLTAESLGLAGYADGSNADFAWSQLCKHTASSSIQGNSSKSSEIHNTTEFGAEINHIELVVGNAAGANTTGAVTFGSELSPSENSVAIGKDTDYSLTETGLLIIPAPSGCTYFKLTWTNGAAYYSSIKVCFSDPEPVAPESVEITCDDEVVLNEALELTASVTPSYASQDVSWEIVSGGTGAGTLEGNILTGTSLGTVVVQATANGTEISEQKTITVVEGKTQVKSFNITAADGSPVTTTSNFSILKNGVTVAVTSSQMSSDMIKVYKNQTLTVSCDSAIASITFTCSAEGEDKYGPGCFTTESGYTFESYTGTWTGSATSVVFTASTNQVRITNIAIVLA